MVVGERHYKHGKEQRYGTTAARSCFRIEHDSGGDGTGHGGTAVVGPKPIDEAVTAAVLGEEKGEERPGVVIPLSP